MSGTERFLDDIPFDADKIQLNNWNFDVAVPKNTAVVYVTQMHLEEGFSITDENGKLRVGKPDDYLVLTPAGKKYIIDRELFELFWEIRR